MIVVPVEASAELKPGQAFLAMHWGSASLGGKGTSGVNALTTPARCPSSHQPELKHAAIRVTKAELPWRLVAFGHAPDGDALLLRDALRPLLEVVPFGQRGADRPRATRRPFPRGCRDTRGCRAARLRRRRIRSRRPRGRPLRRHRRAASAGAYAWWTAGSVRSVSPATPWAKRGCARALVAGQDVRTLRSALLMPTAQAPQGFAPRGRVVCTCFDVAESRLRTCLAASAGTADSALREAQQILSCGTNCGSCLPELKRLAAETRVAASVPPTDEAATGASLRVVA